MLWAGDQNCPRDPCHLESLAIGDLIYIEFSLQKHEVFQFTPSPHP